MAATEPNSSGTGWAWAVVVVIVLVIVVKCSPSNRQVAQPFSSPSLTNQIEAIVPPATIDPFDAKSAKRAADHLRIVIRAEGLSGAMIYSQNCYDVLTRTFTWKKLDECGSFDLLAVRVAGTQSLSGLDTESQYFDPEAAAGRYLAAATKAGEEPEKADARLEALTRRTQGVSLPASRATVPATGTPPVENGPAPNEDVSVDV